MTSIRELVAAELAEPVDPRVSEMAAVIAASYPKAARAVLFYGSCLREHQLEGLMLDFYLIVSSYGEAYGRSWLAPANRLIPPNVFPFAHGPLAAKYAVLSEADFLRECGLGARSVSVYARFAQPARLVWAADEAARTRAIEAVSLAAPTLLRLAGETMSDAERSDSLNLWRQAFRLTFGAELRAERASRPEAIIEADPQRYRRFADVARLSGTFSSSDPARRQRAMRRWRARQRRGKRTTALRLAKASFTFAGGVDYLAWKINRHAGTNIALKPWQRRWPLLAAFTLLPRLLRRGAVR